jgi:hypothetical protein
VLVGVGTVEEEIDAGDVPIDEAGCFESRFGRVQVEAKNQQVHLLSEVNG